ncbi:MAG: HEAT repeat domain-containing protein [Myxococcaceae bacterium]
MRLSAVALIAVCLLSSDHRVEAQAEVHRLLAGANPWSTLSRLKYLGEQRFAAVELAKAWDVLDDAELRRNVAVVVAGLEVARTEPLLVEFTQSSDSAIRMSGAQGLGRIRSRQLPVLVPLLQDSSLGVRREAARALGASRDNRRVGKLLLEAAKIEGEPEVRAAMLEAVGRCGDTRLASALAAFLTSSSDATRFAAARGLCLLGARQGFEFAGGLLASEDRFVRRQGVALFEQLPAKVAKPHLEPKLEDPDRRVAASAARILYQGGDASKLEWLVLASHLSKPDDKLIFEEALETLMLTDERRKAILRKAGIR